MLELRFRLWLAGLGVIAIVLGILATIPWSATTRLDLVAAVAIAGGAAMVLVAIVAGMKGRER